MLTYNYYGHACFQLDDGTTKILVDPFLTGNPQASISEKDVEADYILITHAHGDHIGDAPNIAVRTNATVVGIPEIMDFGGQRVKTIGMNLGGTIKTEFGFVRMVPALHSSGIGGGVACGYVIGVGGKIIYFAGDTALFSDMKLIGERDKILLTRQRRRLSSTRRTSSPCTTTLGTLSSKTRKIWLSSLSSRKFTSSSRDNRLS